MLPPKIPRKAKRASRWRSQAHCNFVRSFYCAANGCMERPIEVAHVRNGSGAGVGQKPDDWRGVPLCRTHHAKQHSVGERSFWAEVACRDPEALIAELVKASPKRREIEEAMKERGIG